MTHFTTWDDGTRRIEPTWVQNASYCCRFLDLDCGRSMGGGVFETVERVGWGWGGRGGWVDDDNQRLSSPRMIRSRMW